MSTMSKEDYSKWYYENYTKKGKKVGKKGGSATGSGKNRPVNPNAQKQKQKSTTSTQAQRTKTLAEEGLLLSKLNDDAKEEIKAYKISLREAAFAQKAELDAEYEELKAQKKKDINTIKSAIEKKNAEMAKKNQQHVAEMNKKINDLYERLGNMTFEERAKQSIQIEKEIRDIQAEHRAQKEKLSNEFAMFKSACADDISIIQEAYTTIKTQNREARRSIASAVREEYRAALEYMLSDEANLRKRKQKK